MGVGDGMLQGLKDIVGANQKAILEIADFNEKEVRMTNAQAPNATNNAPQGMNAADSGFSPSAMSSVAGMDDLVDEEGFVSFKDFRKFRFECQFNPEEITVSGYGGEEVPVQSYRSTDDKNEMKMSSAKTHIDMNFKLVFDKTNIQDAFYIDKFTLSGTNVVKGVGTAIAKALGKKYTVQTEVEALTAIVRDNKKTLARFVWGDMIYEGIINTVNAEYVMFNVNCEPIRAFVNMSMTLYDEEVSGAKTDRWIKEYMRDIYSVKQNALGGLASAAAEAAEEGIDANSSLDSLDSIMSLL